MYWFIRAKPRVNAIMWQVLIDHRLIDFYVIVMESIKYECGQLKSVTHMYTTKMAKVFGLFVLAAVVTLGNLK